jgi:hypothetical protein
LASAVASRLNIKSVSLRRNQSTYVAGFSIRCSTD